MINKNREKNRGFTLFVAVVTAGVLLLVATGVANLAVRQTLISSSGKESQYAFYAADTGIECALYWDVNDPSGVSAFSTSSISQIQCGGSTFDVGGTEESIFGPITFSSDPYCAYVTVIKDDDGSTTIESRGYNTCDTSNRRRVERAIRAKY